MRFLGNRADGGLFKIRESDRQEVFGIGSEAACGKRNSPLFVLRGKDVPLPANTGFQSKECRVEKITKMGMGSQPDWSWDGKFITFIDKVKDSYEIYIMNADGTNRRCMTCEGSIPREFSSKHKGKPVFYPSDSRYILFSVENEYGDHSLRTMPGIGDNHDLWMTNVETGEFWRLTKLSKDLAIQYPRFSSDGTKLLWSQRYAKDFGKAIWQFGCEYGFWKLELSTVDISQGVPTLKNLTESEPFGFGYYEPHGFLPGSNTTIIMTAQTHSLNPSKSGFYLDIIEYDMQQYSHKILASTNDLHYEMATYAPNGKKIAYMAGPFVGLLNGPHKTDLYIANSDGTGQFRLTYFNEPTHEDYINATAQIQKLAWSPKGDQMISAYYNHKAKESTLFKIGFKGSCGD